MKIHKIKLEIVSLKWIFKEININVSKRFYLASIHDLLKYFFNLVRIKLYNWREHLGQVTSHICQAKMKFTFCLKPLLGLKVSALCQNQIFIEVINTHTLQGLSKSEAVAIKPQFSDTWLIWMDSGNKKFIQFPKFPCKMGKQHFSNLISKWTKIIYDPLLFQCVTWPSTLCFQLQPHTHSFTERITI